MAKASKYPLSKLHHYAELPSFIPEGVPYRHNATDNVYQVHSVALRDLSLVLDEAAPHTVIAHYSEDPVQRIVVQAVLQDDGSFRFRYGSGLRKKALNYDHDRMVLYSRDGVFWLRPESMFYECVQVDGIPVPVPRFVRLGEEK